MKRLFVAALLALSSIAFGATTIPVQLISPVGSTTGQVILSNGPVTAPGWGSVPPAALAAQAANTLLGNATASSAAPTAITVPSCSNSAAALVWTAGVGFGCRTNAALTTSTLAQFTATTSAQLAGIVSDETGSGALVFGTNPVLSGASISGGGGINGVPIGGTTAAAGSFTSLNSTSGSVNANLGVTTPGTARVTTLAASGTITPSTTAGIVGTTLGDAAQAGSVGEVPSSSAGPTSLTSGTTTNLVSKSVTPGDYEVSCTVQSNPAGTTTTSSMIVGITTTSGAFGGLGTYSQLQMTTAGGYSQVLASPTSQINVTSSTTVFCEVNVTFGISTMTATGVIHARRVR